jgi:hypothetical protein
MGSDPDGPGGPVSGVSLAGPTPRRPGGPGHVCGPHLAGFQQVKTAGAWVNHGPKCPQLDSR